MSETYRYAPLEKDGDVHFRLMKVLDTDGQNIHLSIECFPLEVAPPFTALSYMWGDTAKPHVVLVDGKELRITDSLFKFFQQTRLQHKAETEQAAIWTGWLWIDAVCINQDDKIERGQQVGHMRAIYEKAQNILIWLGTAQVETSLAFDLLRGITGAEDEELDFGRDEDEPEYMCRFSGPKTSVRVSNSVLPVVHHLLNSPYWDRAWIIQEASTPKRTSAEDALKRVCLVCAGDQWIDFNQYAEANRRLILAAWNNPLRDTLELHNVANANLETIQFLEDRRFRHQHISALYPMLVRTRTSLATDPKDKLYATMGLTTGADDPELPAPDYTLSAEEVYTQLTINIIARSMSLDCLGSAGLVRTLKVPSWVADWTVQNAPSPFYMVERFHNEDGSVKHEANLFDASKDMKPNISFEIEGAGVLSVNGFTFDTISRVALPRHWPDEDLKAIWQDWIAMVQDLGGTYVAGGSTFDAFASTLKGDYSDCWGDWSAERGSTIEEFTDLDVNAFELHDGIVDSMTWHRRLFVTKKGHLGLVAAAAGVGDHVCILAGSQMPMVLHAVQDKWLFVGQAYVHGIMDGEAVSEGVESFQRTYHIC